ncbi:MAG: hypothetical protein ACP5ML_02130 [Fervidicoccus sp.]
MVNENEINSLLKKFEDISENSPLMSSYDKEYIKELLDSCSQNEKIANYCYDNRLWSSAIYNLCLALEKLYKAIAIFLNFNTKDELKNKVGHDALKSLINGLRKLKLQFLNDRAGSELIKLIDQEINNLTKGIDNKKAYLKLSYDEIKHIIDSVDERIAKNERYLENFSEIIKKSANNNPKLAEAYLKFELSTLKLTHLVAITSAHYFSANYPDDPDIAYKDYNESLGIVKFFKEAMNILRESKKSLEELMETYETAFLPE